MKCNDIVLLRSSSSARYFAGFPTGYTALLRRAERTPGAARSTCCHFCASTPIKTFSCCSRIWACGSTSRLIARSCAKLPKPSAWAPASRRFSTMRWSCRPSLNRGVSLEDARDYAVVGCVELPIPGRTYGLHDIAMFNLLKVMEIVLQENEHQPDVSWDGLICQIRDKIRHYIKLMVEGQQHLRYRPPRLGAGPAALLVH